jgi:hypothetical protein
MLVCIIFQFQVLFYYPMMIMLLKDNSIWFDFMWTFQLIRSGNIQIITNCSNSVTINMYCQKLRQLFLKFMVWFVGTLSIENGFCCTEWVCKSFTDWVLILMDRWVDYSRSTWNGKKGQAVSYSKTYWSLKIISIDRFNDGNNQYKFP